MKDKIRINKVYIKMGVLTWIVLALIILFISVSPTEAGNSTITQENTGNSLTEKTTLEISGNDLEQVINDLKKEIKVKNSADSHEDTVDSVQKNGGASDTDTSKSDSTDPKGKAAESNEAKNSGSQVVDLDKEKAVESEAKSQKAANTNPDHESIAGGATKSVQEGVSSPEQTTVEKSETGTSKNNIVDLKPKDDSGIAKAIKSLTNEDTKTESIVSGVTSKKDTDFSCKTQNLPTSSTEKPQKTVSNPVSCSTNSGSNSSVNNSDFNVSGNYSGSNSSGNESGINSSGNESGINSNSTDPGINSNGTDTGIISSSTDPDPDSGGKSYGIAHIIHTSYSTPYSGGSKPIVNTAEAIGLKDLQPRIAGNLAQASLISSPSRSGSFLIGFMGMLLVLFAIMRIRK